MLGIMPTDAERQDVKGRPCLGTVSLYNTRLMAYVDVDLDDVVDAIHGALTQHRVHYYEEPETLVLPDTWHAALYRRGMSTVFGLPHQSTRDYLAVANGVQVVSRG